MMIIKDWDLSVKFIPTPPCVQAHLLFQPPNCFMDCVGSSAAMVLIQRLVDERGFLE